MEITTDYLIIGAACVAILLVCLSFGFHLDEIAKARRLEIPTEPEKSLESLLDETFTGDLDWPHRRRNPLVTQPLKEVVHRSTQ